VRWKHNLRHLGGSERIERAAATFVTAGKGGKMDKASKTTTELEVLVLAELHAIPGCQGVAHVTVIPHDDYRVQSTWEVASFDQGTSDWSHCERALCGLVSRLQKRFDVSR
jgi:hypothetical protein